MLCCVGNRVDASGLPILQRPPEVRVSHRALPIYKALMSTEDAEPGRPPLTIRVRHVIYVGKMNSKLQVPECSRQDYHGEPNFEKKNIMLYL
jgi:hypothetical protein